MAKFACVRQHSEEDCGAACLATVALQYGKRLSLAHLRDIVGTGSSGTTLLGLRRGADSVGFYARAVRANQALIEKLDSIPLPSILHWKGNHWVVLHAVRGKRFLIADPAIGLRWLEITNFREGWSNYVMLVMEPDLHRLNEQSDSPSEPSNFMRFLRMALPYRKLLAQVLSINLIIGLLGLGMPLLMQILTDDVLVRRDTSLLTSLGIGMLLLFLFRNIVYLLQGHLAGHFAQRIQLEMLLEYGHRLFQLPMSYFDSRRSGEVVSRVNDVSRVNSLITDIVLTLPSQVFIAIISVSLMNFYSWRLTLVSLIAFIIVVASNFIFFPALKKRTQRLVIENAENQGFLVESFRAAQVLKTTDATPQVWSEYQTNIGNLSFLRWKTLQLQLFSSTTTELLSSITSLSLLWYGSSFVISGDISIGQLLAFNAMGQNVLQFLSSVVAFAGEFITAQVVIRRLSDVLTGETEDPHGLEKPWVSLPLGCDITCQNLSFHHVGRLELINDLNLTIPGGKTTALIGESGCGKSTFAKLLSGLYHPQQGTIHYGPYGLKDLSMQCLRRQVALVPQDPQFFSRSILDNLKIAHPEAGFEHVVNACQVALADEFIRELPDGYHTTLGEFGARLSGGQLQRLAIARALLGRPPVLILDESTSALDPMLERRLLNNLIPLRQDLTTIMVSHRASVIFKCDWVVYMERGNVKFEGSPYNLRQDEAFAPYLLPA